MAFTVENTRDLISPWLHVFLYGPTGSAKCLGKDTPVLRYDGKIVPAQDVKQGDLLMGPDSKPRKVLSTTVGNGPLVMVTPTKGTPWICNDVHVLTLVRSDTDEVQDVAVDEFRRWSATQKHVAKLFRTGVTFAPGEALPLDPYFLGVWFGDGSKQRSRSGELSAVSVSKPDPQIKVLMESIAALFPEHYVRESVSGVWSKCPTYHIASNYKKNAVLDLLRSVVGETLSVPQQYLTASRKDRLAFLAGWLDTDGSLGAGCITISQKRKDYADAVAFLARSLGFSAYVKPFEAKLNGKSYGTHYRMAISGDLSVLPMRIPRKLAQPRKQRKDPLRTGFELTDIGDGDYYGFTLDGDGRFLLGDFTVTHNTLSAATFPNAFFIVPDNEQSIVTLKGLDVPYVKVTDRATFDEVLRSIEDAYTGGGEQALRDRVGDTVVIESLSHYVDLVIEDLTQGGKGMDQRLWGMVASHFRNIQARLRRLPIHVVYTALAEEVLDEQGRVSGVRPLIQGSTKMKLPSACDVIAYCEALPGKPPIYQVHTTPYKNIQARSRIQGIPSPLKDFHFNKIAQAVGAAPSQMPPVHEMLQAIIAAQNSQNLQPTT